MIADIESKVNTLETQDKVIKFGLLEAHRYHSSVLYYLNELKKGEEA